MQVFHVRGGRVRGQRGWVVDKVEDVTTGDLVEQFCLQVYGADDADDACPREVLVPRAAAGPRRARAAALRAARQPGVAAGAAARRQAGAAGDRRPQRRAGLRAAQAQAGQRPDRPLAGAGRDPGRARAGQAPLRIECFDVSHVQGTNVVASMVVFEDGLPRKSEYRRFAIRGTGARDPDGGPRHRGRRRGLDPGGGTPPDGPLPGRADGQRRGGRRPARRRPAARRPGSTRRPAGRASSPTRRTWWSSTAAPRRSRPRRAALAELGIDDVALCGLAKRLEEVWLPGEDQPVILPRTSEGLYLLQRVRDEAHRFAITYHRQKRSKAMTTSALDGVPGLGETRQKALLTRFGSLKRLRAASVEDIMAVPGVGPAHRRGGVRRAAPAGRRTPARRWTRSRERCSMADFAAAAARGGAAGLEVVVVTGLSGAGRSTAAKCLEDLG